MLFDGVVIEVRNHSITEQARNMAVGMLGKVKTV
jgi:hypothetical protein